MTLRFSRRSGVALLIIALLVGANLLAWRWLRGGSELAPVAPRQVSQALPALPEVDRAQSALPVDSLWQRYQQINGRSALADSGSDVAERHQQRQDEIAAARQKRDEARARREARRAQLRAMKQALTEFNTALASITPGDSRQVLAAVERLNSKLTRAGLQQGIDISLLQQLVAKGERLKTLNAALIAESAKGADADGDRLVQLSQALTTLQSEMPDMMRQLAGLTAGGRDVEP